MKRSTTHAGGGAILSFKTFLSMGSTRFFRIKRWLSYLQATRGGLTVCHAFEKADLTLSKVSLQIRSSRLSLVQVTKVSFLPAATRHSEQNHSVTWNPAHPLRSAGAIRSGSSPKFCHVVALWKLSEDAQVGEKVCKGLDSGLTRNSSTVVGRPLRQI